MARTPKARPAAAKDDGKMRALEAELAKATEHFRLAKLASREAKANAKIAKKQMKQARKAMIAAQEEQEQMAELAVSKKAKAAASKRTRAKIKATSSPVLRTVDTPELVRKPRSKRSQAGASAAPPDSLVVAQDVIPADPIVTTATQDTLDATPDEA